MIKHETENRIKLSQISDYDRQAKSKVYRPWDLHYIEAEIDNWNDDLILLEYMTGMILNEDDQWVNPP
jgi:hypothetical protein